MSAGGVEAQSRALPDIRWRRWVLTALGVFAAAFVLFAAFVALVDPYDTGRFLSVLPHGVSDEAPRTANASRGRDPRFNAAIIGNSYSQLLDPARLSASTGLSFVQMTVPGTGPREHVTLLKWFLQNHPNARAVALGLDETWCVTDPALPLYNPFPFWLYDNGANFYARHLSSRSIEMGVRRIRLALGKAVPTDAAGYWDYEQGRVWNFRPELSDAGLIDMSPRRVDQTHFPAGELLARALADVPPNVKLIAYMPPQHRSALPPPDTEKHTRFVGCKHELAQRVHGRGNSVLLDFFRDTPESRDAENFMDSGHYRAPIARHIEREIAAAIAK